MCYCQILIIDDEADFALICVSPHPLAKGRELSLALSTLNCCGVHVGVDDHGIVLHQYAALLIVSPDTSRPRVCCGASKNTTEQVKGRINPLILVDGSLTISLHTRDEEDNE